MQIIHLSPEDDIVSINDRLDWHEEQQLLLVLPERGSVLREGLDLVRLRRHADGLRLEVGLVTADPDLSDQAKALGFPTFASAESAANSRLGWWRGKRRRETVGLPTVGGWRKPPRQLDLGDRQEMHRRLTPAAQWRRWLLRYAAILIFFLTLALLFVGFTYAVPGATITLHPNVQTLQVARQIVADPSLTEASGASVPGRVLVVVETWQADVATTGAATVPNSPARGTVTFINQVAQEVEVPVGTRVRTSDGSNVIFQTTGAVTVPDVVGGTADVEVIAIEPGVQGNVPANLVNQIEGALAFQLEVINLADMEGGAVREAQVVAAEDQVRLRAQVLQFIQAVAQSEMEAQLTAGEFLAVDSLRVGQVFNETYSHFVGEQTTLLSLEMRVEMAGTAVNTTDASGLIFDALAEQVPDSFTLVPNSIQFENGEVLGVAEDGRITFEMLGTAQVAADLALAAPLAAINGQPPDIAAAYLYQSLPLRDVPVIQVWPIWFDRVPYLPARIQMDITTTE
ncbi:MAG: baseplate J/gp47 family protein [Ardenticatenaceae bacterium]|nr:baseplate J/gp47 family protein [Ardenticatenaceae bacterium]